MEKSTCDQNFGARKKEKFEIWRFVIERNNMTGMNRNHSMKSVQIWSFFWPLFSCIPVNSDKIFPYTHKLREKL